MVRCPHWQNRMPDIPYVCNTRPCSHFAFFSWTFLCQYFPPHCIKIASGKDERKDVFSLPECFFSTNPFLLLLGGEREARLKVRLDNCRLISSPASIARRKTSSSSWKIFSSLFCLLGRVGMKQCSCWTGRRCEFLVISVSSDARLNLERTAKDLVSLSARIVSGIGTRDWNSKKEERRPDQEKKDLESSLDLRRVYISHQY